MPTKTSYDLKLDRAEQHLVEIEDLVLAYADNHPHEVTVGMEGQRKVHRLRFTKQPEDRISVVAGDFLYNIHSALNHLAASLVPSDERRSVSFPIFWQGVWDGPVEGENEQRTKDRERWQTYTRRMPPEAVAIIKANQPPDSGSNEPSTHALAVLNRLRNVDAHTKLVVVATSLRFPTGTARTSGGTVQFRSRDMGSMEGLQDGAELMGLPDDVVDVQLTRTPAVVVRIGQMKEPGGVLIGEGFRDLLLDGTRKMADMLRPFDRVNTTS